MNEYVKSAILNELVDICAENTTAYKLRKSINKIEEIVDGKK